MIFKVDDSIISKTSECEKNLSCMSEKRKELCKVTRNVEDKVYFIECQRWSGFLGQSKAFYK